MLIASMAPHGPTAIAIRTPPTACPVVPPGSGMLNIMMMNVKVAEMASRGTFRVVRLSFSLRAATRQRGMHAA
jgi:hypothetical protein